jgi:transcriptional regulator with XRE-family HTH domain
MEKIKKLSNFSKNLKRIRKERGLSQYDLADITGISQQMIAHYETNVTEPPLDKIEVIAKTLKVEISDLLYNDNLNPSTDVDITKFDTRSLKKLQEILSLPQNDRADIYRLLNKLIRKNQLELKEKNKQLQEVSK